MQFKGKNIDELPNLYLATPEEVATRLKKTANNRGDTILYERKEYIKKSAAAMEQLMKFPIVGNFQRRGLNN